MPRLMVGVLVVVYVAARKRWVGAVHGHPRTSSCAEISSIWSMMKCMVAKHLRWLWFIQALHTAETAEPAKEQWEDWVGQACLWVCVHFVTCVGLLCSASCYSSPVQSSPFIVYTAQHFQRVRWCMYVGVKRIFYLPSTTGQDEICICWLVGRVSGLGFVFLVIPSTGKPSPARGKHKGFVICGFIIWCRKGWLYKSMCPIINDDWNVFCLSCHRLCSFIYC